MPQLYNAASDIIAAFQQGLMERRQKEQDLLNQQNKDKAFQEDQRQFNEQQKRAQNAFDLQLKNFEADEKYRQSQLNFQKEKAKLDIKRAMLAGEMPIPGKTVRQDWASTASPETFVPEDYTNNDLGITIPTSELPNLQNYIGVQRALDSAKGAGELERAQAVAKINADAQAAAIASRENIADKNIASRLLMQENSLGAMMERLGLSLANKGNSSDRRDRSAVVGVADKIKTDPLYKNWQGTVDGYNYVTKVIPDPKAPGINDMRLIFMWVRALDNSRVTKGEFDTVTEFGVPWLKAKGLQFKRLTDNSVILPPEARRALVNDIKSVYQSRKVEWNKLVSSAYERAKYLDPDVKDEDFRKLVYSGDSQEQNNLPKGPEGVQILRRVK